MMSCGFGIGSTSHRLHDHRMRHATTESGQAEERSRDAEKRSDTDKGSSDEGKGSDEARSSDEGEEGFELGDIVDDLANWETFDAAKKRKRAAIYAEQLPAIESLLARRETANKKVKDAKTQTVINTLKRIIPKIQALLAKVSLSPGLNHRAFYSCRNLLLFFLAL